MRRVRDRVREMRGPEWEQELRAVGLPERYWTATAKAITGPLGPWTAQALADAPKWLGEGFGWFLHGPFNAGKSSLAAILAMDAIARCEVVTWLCVRDLAHVRFREDDDAKKVDDRLKRSDLLVLDDLGGERFRLTTAAGTALEETARIFYDRRRSVIVTSNVSWRVFHDGAYIRDIPAFVSVVDRLVRPVEIVNGQWPGGPV